MQLNGDLWNDGTCVVLKMIDPVERSLCSKGLRVEL